MTYIISFHCIASLKAFIKKNLIADTEIIEKGSTYIKVNSSFINQANWIKSSYVYQINKTSL